MNKKLLLMLGVSLMLAACGNESSEEDAAKTEGEVTEESAETDANASEDPEENLESTEAEDAEVENESSYISMDDETLNNSYLFTSDERRSNVTFDNGIIRFSDGDGNLRYRLANDGDRLVISGEEPQVYLFSENDNGYELINIDNEGKRTGSNITLESR
ncbi:hypothetical protein [Jeotgalicoccus sp. ATCC 8456]|uniref:hypothetical protein n=1 Tax=Jeotgalicoccus sp. ATCC 8456 TaxID=946435 RepID=UPI0018E60FEA|nr:hypothetical protein [Jeotgalicoccus sp. ATCC 8456]QQD85669.1 hypothetical protein JEM45_03325 [Jeotgalicoccus sp. ATCC 8456]